MEPMVAIAVLMVWAVLVLIMWMTCLGYDIRSRGFNVPGPAVAVFPKMNITFKDYFSKRGEHPVTDESFVSKVRFYKMASIAASALFFVIAVLLFVI